MKEAIFKETEIGKIPVDWDTKVVEKSVTLKARIGWQGLTTKEYLEIGDYCLITGTDFKDGYIDWDNCVYVEKLRFDQDKNIQIKNNDVLVTKDGTIGKVALVKNVIKPTTLNSGVFVLRPFVKDINSKFLFFVLNSFYFDTFICNITAGSTITHLYQKDFVKFRFVVPPLAEQEKIAEVLSDTDLWIESTEALLAKKRLLKKGAMQKLLSPKEDWEVKKLGEVCEITMGQSPPSSFYNTTGIGLPLIQGNADINNRKTIKRNFSSTYTKIGKKGDIIMSVRAPVGEIATATFECCLGRGVCGIRYPNLFIYHQLLFLENSWSKFSTGSTFDSVNSQQVKELEIQFPPLKKQQEIAEILSSMDLEIESLENRLQKARQIKQGMMQDLLTGKVRLG